MSAELVSDSQGGTWACEFLTLLGITLTTNGILKCVGKAVGKGKTLFPGQRPLPPCVPLPSGLCLGSY